MAPYMYKRNNEGIHIINVAKTWEKLMIAARIIAAIPNPRDILVSYLNDFLFCILNVGDPLFFLSIRIKQRFAFSIDRLKQRIRLKSRP